MPGGRYAGTGVGLESLQHRQRESGGFAGAGLCTGHYILTQENRRYRLLLDGGGRAIALLLDCVEQLGDEAEITELHASGYS